MGTVTSTATTLTNTITPTCHIATKSPTLTVVNTFSTMVPTRFTTVTMLRLIRPALIPQTVRYQRRTMP